MPRTLVLQNRSEEDNLIKRSTALIILFMNPHCGHCVTLKPKFEAFSDRYPNITFAVIDTSKTPAIDLEGVPTMVVYKNGQNIDIIVGADERRLQQALDNLSGTQGTFNNSRIR